MDTQNPSNAPKRPLLLSLLCIVALLGAILLLILYLSAGVFAGILTGSGGLDSGSTELWLKFILILAGILIGLIGVMKMWRLKRSGFYMFVGGVGSVLAVNEVMGEGTGNVGWIISGALVFLFALNVGHLK